MRLTQAEACTFLEFPALEKLPLLIRYVRKGSKIHLVSTGGECFQRQMSHDTFPKIPMSLMQVSLPSVIRGQGALQKIVTCLTL